MQVVLNWTMELVDCCERPDNVNLIHIHGIKYYDREGETSSLRGQCTHSYDSPLCKKGCTTKHTTYVCTTHYM